MADLEQVKAAIEKIENTFSQLEQDVGRIRRYIGGLANTDLLGTYSVPRSRIRALFKEREASVGLYKSTQ